MTISNDLSVPLPVTSISPNSHSRQINALGVTARIALLCKTIFQSFLNLFFNYIDKAQLQRQWRQIYTGQKEVSLFPSVQNASEMRTELINFCRLYLNSNKDNLVAYGERFQSLPESIGNLVNLKKINLLRTQLQTLPESIGNLVNLTSLLLSENQLQTLPESIGNLVNLTHLGLRYNQFQALPDSIGNLVNLKDLDLIGNQLQALPESIGKLINLTKIELNHNRLQSLPESIGKLINLTKD